MVSRGIAPTHSMDIIIITIPQTSTGHPATSLISHIILTEESGNQFRTMISLNVRPESYEFPKIQALPPITRVEKLESKLMGVSPIKVNKRSNQRHRSNDQNEQIPHERAIRRSHTPNRAPVWTQVITEVCLAILFSHIVLGKSF